MALEMVPTSADVLGINTPKGLPSFRENVMPSRVTNSRGRVDWVWVRMRGGCELIDITLSKWAQGRHEAWSL